MSFTELYRYFCFSDQFECANKDLVDNFLFGTSCISLFYLIHLVLRVGSRARITTIWLAVAFIQSVLLFSRGNQESLSTETKQRLLFLWAVQILCCLIVFLWSFQDLPVNISPNKRK